MEYAGYQENDMESSQSIILVPGQHYYNVILEGNTVMIIDLFYGKKKKEVWHTADINLNATNFEQQVAERDLYLYNE
jgi:uncharacterized 2Fe-2S/4Fe-4S cluster protein (DUF4445 family)